MMTDFGDDLDPEACETPAMVLLWRVMYFYGMIWEGDLIEQPYINKWDNPL